MMGIFHYSLSNRSIIKENKWSNVLILKVILVALHWDCLSMKSNLIGHLCKWFIMTHSYYFIVKWSCETELVLSVIMAQSNMLMFNWQSLLMDVVITLLQSQSGWMDGLTKTLDSNTEDCCSFHISHPFLSSMTVIIIYHMLVLTTMTKVL